MAIVSCQVIVDEIGKRFASGKPIVVGGRELIGYTRDDGTVFKRWVPKAEAPDEDADYVEFVALQDLDTPTEDPQVEYVSDAPDDAVIQAQAALLRAEQHAQRPSVRDLPPSDDGPE